MYQLNIEISPNWSFAAFSRQGTVFFIEIFPYSKRMMSSISRSLKTSFVLPFDPLGPLGPSLPGRNC